MREWVNFDRAIASIWTGTDCLSSVTLGGTGTMVWVVRCRCLGCPSEGLADCSAEGPVRILVILVDSRTGLVVYRWRSRLCAVHCHSEGAWDPEGDATEVSCRGLFDEVDWGITCTS